MLFLAMSCLQARPQSHAFKHLTELKPDGIQLTPGNHPTPGFKESVNVPYTLHHGFCWDKYRREVYDENLQPIDIETNRSIHPPKVREGFSFEDWITSSGDYIFETMYPGYYLGSGDEIEIAMAMGKRLAVDISHLHIQVCAGVLTPTMVNKIISYDKVYEIHVSHNNGKYDSHNTIIKDTPFLSSIKGRNVNIIYESYLHKLSLDDRKYQIDLVRNAI